jgi:hypothetical protein
VLTVALKKVTYIGPFDEVEIETPLGGWLTCKRNCTVEVTADLAASLCEQADNWTTAGKSATTGEE